MRKLLFLSSVLTFSFAGDIQGKIIFDGKAPKMNPLRMDADPVCVANSDIKPRKEWLVLDENNGVKNVLVMLRKASLDLYRKIMIHQRKLQLLIKKVVFMSLMFLV